MKESCHYNVSPMFHNNKTKNGTRWYIVLSIEICKHRANTKITFSNVIYYMENEKRCCGKSGDKRPGNDLNFDCAEDNITLATRINLPFIKQIGSFG